MSGWFENLSARSHILVDIWLTPHASLDLPTGLVLDGFVEEKIPPALGAAKGPAAAAACRAAVAAVIADIPGVAHILLFLFVFTHVLCPGDFLCL